MKSKLFLIASILLTVCVLAMQSFFFIPNQEPIKFSKGNTFKKEWAKVDSLEQLGLPKSGLQIVETIYEKAKTEKNHEQYIKATIFKMKYKNLLEENAYETILKDFETEVTNAPFPCKPLMHSLLAEMYWMYFDANRWKFLNRTSTIGYTPNDIKTWDINMIVNKSILHYQWSLTNEDSLQRVPISNFDEILEKGTLPQHYRPTLYDFLAHRAIDFFSNNVATLTRPANKFLINQNFYFAPAETFIQQKIETTDTLSLEYYAAITFQKLIAFRLKDTKNPEALYDAEIKRFDLFKNLSTSDIKDSLYIKAMYNLKSISANSPLTTEICYRLSEFFNIRSSKYDALNPETFTFKNDKKTVFQLCNEAIKKFPESNGAKKCKLLLKAITSKNISFNYEPYVPSSSAFACKINYQNITKLYVRLSSVNKKVYTDIRQSANYTDRALYENCLAHAKPIEIKNLDLPNDDDYNTHSVEYIFNGLPVGIYLIEFSDNEKFMEKSNLFTAYNFVTITDISYAERRNNDGSYDIYLMHRLTGQPLVDVTAQLWYSEYDYSQRAYKRIKGQSYTSDKNGYIYLPYSPENKNFKIEFIKSNDDILETDQIFYAYFYPSTTETNYKTFFFTDRAIYRPGQIVYFKGIMIKTDSTNTNQIAPNQTETITLYDVNSQKKAELTLTTNEYGTFSGNFVLPTGQITGKYYLQSKYGSCSFSVEEYKRPKFEVSALPVEGSPRLNDSVTIKGVAKSYTGSSISNAKVTYRITRKPQWKGWWEQNIFYAETEIASGITSTTNNGEYTITFKAIPDASIEKNNYVVFNYSAQVDVTDINGETRSTQSIITIGYSVLDARLKISEIINKDSIPKIDIITQNLNGNFLPAQGEIKIYKLIEPAVPLKERLWECPDKYFLTEDEWKKQYPGNLYKDETTPQKMLLGENIYKSNFNTAYSKTIVLSSLKKWPTGKYVAIIQTKDTFGNTVENKHYFTVYSSSSTQMPAAYTSWFTAIKNQCEPDQKAYYIIGSSYNNVRVLYEIEKHSTIIKKQFITLSNEQKLIELPITEEYRGNIAVHFTFIYDNRFYYYSDVINVPYSNKKLDISFETFRNKLMPGEQEEWKIKIKGPKGEKIAAEMLATLYDASLDQFTPNAWYFDILKYYYAECNLKSNTFTLAYSRLFNIINEPYEYATPITYDKLNWFGFSYYNTDMFNTPFGGIKSKKGIAYSTDRMVSQSAHSPEYSKPLIANDNLSNNMVSDKTEAATQTTKKQDIPVKTRTNFNETAFFYPHLKTDQAGNCIISFTIPDALTSWKMLGFAHTKDLKFGNITNTLITQKDLMVIPNVPRFFRENDTLLFSTKITNLSDNELKGTVQLLFNDAITTKSITPIITNEQQKSFSITPNGNTLVVWKLIIPQGLQAINYKIIASSGNFTDGEENTIPVLTNRILITETLPIYINGKQQKNYVFNKLVNSNSSTLTHEKLTFEFSQNPAWYAIQALPYLMESQYECSEEIFNRFYANSIANHIINTSPRIKAVFDAWQNTKTPDALLSNLEKNVELKSLLLQETPWVLNAQNETERKKRIALLFDINTMANQLNSSLHKLFSMQSENGGWSWFPGMPDNRYITQYIVCGFGHLDKLGIKNIRSDKITWNMLLNAVSYLDERIAEDFAYLKKHYSYNKLQENNLSYTAIQYLYMRSFFTDIEIPTKTREAYYYYREQSEKYWLSQTNYMKALIALQLYRTNKKSIIPTTIIKSLNEYAQHSDEMGMYWSDNTGGYYWYQAPIETQALMIELYDEVGNDPKSVEELKIWLLKQKQTQDWKTTRATAEAIYALLLKGTDWLTTDNKNIKIKIGNINLDNLPELKAEVGTGYIKTSWNKNEISPELGKISLTKSDAGISWGAIYWQYFEQLDKITPHATPLKVNKKLFVERLIDGAKLIEPINEKTNIRIGDKIIVRIELTVDRDLEYVHLKDMRASGLEPNNIFSSYKYQGGIGYYESTTDAATNFFIEYLNKGTYVFEYSLRASNLGNFSNGITTVQCLYAPEFTSHSEGIRISISE